MTFGLIGNAGDTTRSLVSAGLKLIARPINDEARQGFTALGVQTIEQYQEFWDHIEHPRIVVMDMPAGKMIDELIDAAYVTMEPADVVIDASRSYWCDTLRRYRRMRHRALYYVDIAWIQRDGQAILLAGGDDAAIAQTRPFLEAYCPNFQHLGGPAISHYAAVIEECLEHAKAQVMNEAALMMEAWPIAVAEDIMKQLWPLVDRPEFGRAAWQLDDAVQLEAATPLLAQTAMQAISEALDEHRSQAPPPRVGPFQHPDEII